MRDLSTVLLRATLVVAAVGFGCSGRDEATGGQPAVDVSEPVAADSPLIETGADPYIDRIAIPFRAAGTNYLAQAGTFTARHDGTALEIVPIEPELDPEAAPLTPTSLTLSTSRVTVGTTALAVGSRVTTDVRGDLVIAGINFTEHVAARADGVEQTWEFPTAPGGAGDLVVTLGIGGAPFITETATGLHFGAAGSLGIAYSTGHWLDAAGQNIEIVPSWHDGEIELRVPRAVLDAAVFPARLDPTISAEKVVDAPIPASPTGASSQFADVAFSGAQYLAVWQDSRIDGADIYGVRMTTTGALSDAISIPIARKAGAQFNPRVAFVNNRYLVVWENWSTNDLEAAVVAPGTGVVTQLGAVAVTAGLNERKPRIAVRGTEALIVYQTDDDVRAVRYLSTTNTFGAPVTVAATADLEHDPAVAADPAGNYLVTWSDGIVDAITGLPKYSLKAQRVTSAGALTGAAIDVSFGQANQLVPTADFVGGNFVVAWQRQYLGTFGARISPAGVVLDTHTEVVAGVTTTFGGKALTAEKSGTQPVLACAGTKCFVAWTEGRNYPATNFDIYGETLDATLTAVGAEVPVSTAVGMQLSPHVGVAGAGYFVAWSDARDATGYRSAYGARINATGAVLDPSGILFVRGNNREITPALARSTTSWLADWEDSRVGGDNIVGVRVSNAFAINDAPAIDVSNAPRAQLMPAIATDPSTGNYLTTWADRRGATSDIYFARVPQAGATLDTTGVAITTAVGDQLRPDLAVTPSGVALIVWQDGRTFSTTGADIYGALVNNQGTVLVADIPISTAPSHQLTPKVAYDPTTSRFLVTWADFRSGTDWDVYAARVSLAGAVLDPAGVAIAAAHPRGEFAPDVVFGSDRLLLVWAAASDIYGTRVHINGASITRDDATDLPICINASKQIQPRVAYVASSFRDFAVVWTDFRGAATTGMDVLGTTVGEAAGAIGTEFTVANTVEDEFVPTLGRPARANGTNMELLVAYQSSSVAAATYRVKLRQLAFPTVSLVSIAVTPANSSLANGLPRAFTAIGTYSDGSTQNLTATATWSSTVTTVATITGNVAKAVGLGTTKISAIQAGVTGSTNLTVTAPTLVSIAVTPANVTIAKGLTRQYLATGTLSDGSTQNLTATAAWTSSLPAVATIGATGLAKAIAPGTTVISAAQAGITGTTNLTVSAPTLVSIAVTPANVTIAKGQTQAYTATGTLTDGSTQNLTATATWASSLTAVATIDAAGLATSLGQGTTVVSASQGGVIGSTNLTVGPPVLASIDVQPTDPSIAKGTKQQFSATGTFTDGSTQDVTASVSWTSSLATVATINNGGLATGVNLGTSTITATQGAISGTTLLTVTAATVLGVTVTPVDPTAAKNTTLQFDAVADFSDGTQQDVTALASWSSSKLAVATVSSTGLASALAVGSADISASYAGFTDTTTLTVTAAVLVSISVTPITATIAKGTSLQYTATGTFADGSTADITAGVTWTTGSAAIATVTAGGLAIGVGVGTTTVRATQGAITNARNLTVTAATLVSIAVAPATATLARGYQRLFTATGTFSDGTTQNLTNLATWSSSNTTVARVSNVGGSKGRATARATGIATITASFGGKSGTATLTVSGATLTSIAVTPTTVTLAVGQTQQLTAIGTFSDGTTLDLTVQVAWRTSSRATANVRRTGLVTARKKGSATISATKSGVTGSSAVTVP